MTARLQKQAKSQCSINGGGCIIKTDNGNKITMKTETGNKQNLKEKLLLKNVYSFQVKDRLVKVVFSDNSKAPTIESALVKIATRRIG